MSKSDILKKINRALNSDGTEVDFSAFDESISAVKSSLKKKIQAQTLDDVNAQLEKFRRKIDLQPLQDALAVLEQSFSARTETLTRTLEEKFSELESVLSTKSSSQEATESLFTLTTEISDLKTQLSGLETKRKSDVTELGRQITEVVALNKKTDRVASDILKSLDVIRETADLTEEENKEEVKVLRDSMEAFRREFMSRLNNLGGGSMNRQMFIGGVDPLTKFTDVNLKAGAGTTITYTNNNVTQKVDITITATGSGAGITRLITSISSDTTAGATASIDYVYLVSGTTTLTLPTAATNTNLYTVKNVGVGIVTIAPFGLETIDGETSIIMPVQYTSVDIISDNTTWKIT